MIDLIFKHLLTLGHIFFGLFMLLAPFLANDPDTLFLHFQLVLFLLAKWSIKEWECGFTMLEYRLRKIPREDAVLYKVLHPVTDVHIYKYHKIMIIITLVLGMISYYRSEMNARALGWVTS